MHCEVIIENFSPGVTVRLGTDYNKFSKIKHNLIYCSISGFDQEGIMALTGEHDGVPIRCAGAIADYGTGL